MDKMFEGQIVNVQAFKHDGELYRQWNGAKILFNNDQKVVLLLFKTKVKGTKGFWKIYEPTIWFFYKDEFFNTKVIIRKNYKLFYTNIASPIFFEDNVLKYVDYDLDIKTNKWHQIHLVDYNEFKRNEIKYNYSQNLLKIVEETAYELKDNYVRYKSFIENVIDKKIAPFCLENSLFDLKNIKDI